MVAVLTRRGALRDGVGARKEWTTCEPRASSRRRAISLSTTTTTLARFVEHHTAVSARPTVIVVVRTVAALYDARARAADNRTSGSGGLAEEGQGADDADDAASAAASERATIATAARPPPRWRWRGSVAGQVRAPRGRAMPSFVRCFSAMKETNARRRVRSFDSRTDSALRGLELQLGVQLGRVVRAHVASRWGADHPDGATTLRCSDAPPPLGAAAVVIGLRSGARSGWGSDARPWEHIRQ